MEATKYELINSVIQLSDHKLWDLAVTEWEIFDCIDSESCDGKCICGHENIRYMFTIRNVRNGNELFPIGSQCIKKFERQDLTSEVAIYEKLFKLLGEFKRTGYVEFSSKYFSKKLLKFLWDKKCFKATKFNCFDPENDYVFLLDMFNKHSPKSDRQNKKIKALIRQNIVPFLNEFLDKKQR